MNEGQYAYEKEINLKELLFYCLKKWRSIVAAMVVLAVLAGAYKYLSAVRSNQAKLENQAKEEEKDGKDKVEDILDESEDVINELKAEHYRLVIAQSEEALERQKDYLDNSAIMKLDGNHLQTGTLIFCMDFREGDSDALDALVAAYQAYVADGRLARELEKAGGDISTAELQKLISFSDDKSTVRLQSSGTNAVGKSMGELQLKLAGQHVFQVRMFAPDEKLCQKYLETAENAILAYGEELRQEVAQHGIKVLSSSRSEQMSAAISDYQSQLLTEYRNAVDNLNILQTTLKQMEEPEEELEEEEEPEEEDAPLVLENPGRSGVKFAVVGLVLGAFLGAFVWMLVYIMSSRLQSVDSFEEEFGMKLVARVSSQTREGKWFGFVDRWIQRMEEGAFGNIPFEEQMKIASANVKATLAKNEDLKKVMLAGTIAGKDAEAMCAQLAGDVEGITFSDYKQVVFCAADLEELAAYDGVLFLEKKGVSVSELIRQERELAKCRNVAVLGAVVV